MTDERVNLLRKLGAGVIPDGAQRDPAGRPIEGADFPTLLVGAQQGSVRTGLAVLVRAELDEPLTKAQLENLADAADLAMAAGVASVVALIDGRALTLDVPARRITGEIALDEPARAPRDVIDGLDAAVVARPTTETDSNEATRRHVADLSIIHNRSVAELLAGHPEPRRAG